MERRRPVRKAKSRAASLFLLRLPNDEGKEAAHFFIQADEPSALPVLEVLR